MLFRSTIVNKVDKVQGKALSTNDYTNEDKALVVTISNKVDKIAGKGLSTNDYTDIDKSLIDTIPGKANVSDVLTKTNTAEFTPTSDYQPATKRYVDINVIQGGVPQTRTVNGHPLSSDVNLTASDVGAPATTIPMTFSIYNGGLRITYDDGE